LFVLSIFIFILIFVSRLYVEGKGTKLVWMDGWEGKDKRRKIDGTPGGRLFFGSSFHLFGSWFVGCGRKRKSVQWDLLFGER
jgi:hypothetical protein